MKMEAKYGHVVLNLLSIFLTAEILCLPRPDWEKEACKPETVAAQSNYICEDNRIKCLEGWIGDLCQVPVCGNDCDPQHGFCTEPGECRCNLGYSGSDCRQCLKLPGCKHGSCTKSFECLCEEGWSGMFCNKPSCPDSCSSLRGVCNSPGVCECLPGYGGENCDECATPDGCLHGFCTQPGECRCQDGWEGPLCDQPICKPECKGKCSVPGDCECEVGWSGQLCDQCVAYPGCVHGDCQQPWQCNCEAEWTGELCDQPAWDQGWRDGKCSPVGSFLCLNGGTELCRYWHNGTTVQEQACLCLPGYYGTWCESEQPPNLTVSTTGQINHETSNVTTVVLGKSEELSEGSETYNSHLNTEIQPTTANSSQERWNISQSSNYTNLLVAAVGNIVHHQASLDPVQLGSDNHATSQSAPLSRQNATWDSDWSIKETGVKPIVIGLTEKLSNEAEWKGTRRATGRPNHYTGSGRRTSRK